MARIALSVPKPTDLLTRLEEALIGPPEALPALLAEVLRGDDAGDPDGVAERLAAVCELLSGAPELAARAGLTLRQLLRDARVGPALTESGIAPASSFASELARRLVHRGLPDLEDPSDLRTLVRRCFDGPRDHEWVGSVPAESWARLLTILGITAETVVGVDPELETAIRTLAHHVGSVGMAPEFTRRLPHLEDTASPFLALTDSVLAYTRSYASDVDGDELELLRDALATVARCREEVAHLRATKSEHGTSLELTGLTFRLLQMLDRLEVLLHLTDPVERDFQSAATRLFKDIVRAEKTRNDVVPHVRERADLLAYQVVEHAARKGAKYVTSGWRDYSAFFVASLGGGFIVAVFSFVKTWLGGFGLPLGVEGLLYGLNYSLCFVLIYLTGSALATKQPAMTANTIARALGDRDDRQLDGLEHLVVRVWRSQFVSFAGNLAMALPTAFLVSEVWFRSAGATVADPDAAIYMLEALHPWRSGTIVFAAVAGVFLFLAGLISGWVDNRLVYSRVRDRVAVHPWLQRIAGGRRAGAVADFVDRNLGVVTGNVFLGFALGSTGTLGEILGLPLDIRHIAFASAEFGTALEILHLDVAPAVLVPVALGVLAVGLVNFLVSFGLSLVTAMESRRITWRETRALLARLGQSARARPTDWFFPPRGTRSDAA